MAPFFAFVVVVVVKIVVVNVVFILTSDFCLFRLTFGREIAVEARIFLFNPLKDVWISVMIKWYSE